MKPNVGNYPVIEGAQYGAENTKVTPRHVTKCSFGTTGKVNGQQTECNISVIVNRTVDIL